MAISCHPFVMPTREAQEPALLSFISLLCASTLPKLISLAVDDSAHAFDYVIAEVEELRALYRGLSERGYFKQLFVAQSTLIQTATIKFGPLDSDAKDEQHLQEHLEAFNSQAWSFLNSLWGA